MWFAVVLMEYHIGNVKILGFRRTSALLIAVDTFANLVFTDANFFSENIDNYHWRNNNNVSVLFVAFST